MMALKQIFSSSLQKLNHHDSRFASMLLMNVRHESSAPLSVINVPFLDGDQEENSLVLRDPERKKRLEKLRTSKIEIKDPNPLTTISGIPDEHVKDRRVRIYKPSKNSMQSGTFDTKNWKIDFENRERWENPLMGWTSTGDPHSNLHMWFSSKEDAIAYCERNGFHYDVEDAPERRNLRKSYADNFAWNKRTRLGSK